MALTASQNRPSAQLALPMVPKATSSPWFENGAPSSRSSGSSR